MSFEIPGLADAEKTALEDAMSPESFDIFDFVQKTNTPELKVVLYTDAATALELFDLKAKQGKINKENKEAADAFSIADDEDHTYEIEELEEKLRESALTFTVKGMVPKALEAFTKNYEASHSEQKAADIENYNINFNNALTAKSIVSFTDPSGAEHTRDWNSDDVARLVDGLYASEQGKLYTSVARANYVGAIFDAAVSADF